MVWSECEVVGRENGTLKIKIDSKFVFVKAVDVYCSSLGSWATPAAKGATLYFMRSESGRLYISEQPML